MMDTISITLLIAIIGCGISVASFFIARSKDNRENVKEESAKMANLSENILKSNIKLDTICANVSELRVDTKTFQSKINDLMIRQSKTEDKLETAFKRIDELSENINGTKGK